VAATNHISHPHQRPRRFCKFLLAHTEIPGCIQETSHGAFDRDAELRQGARLAKKLKRGVVMLGLRVDAVALRGIV
jgi:hypothetical protein